ncbi:MAG: hypothetical protein OXI86_06770, partial [Candidatus Poribacteria bacterium]|nr:hypothetical protein [Candidatus Poribacteria bacterium]
INVLEVDPAHNPVKKCYIHGRLERLYLSVLDWWVRGKEIIEIVTKIPGFGDFPRPFGPVGITVYPAIANGHWKEFGRYGNGFMECRTARGFDHGIIGEFLPTAPGKE